MARVAPVRRALSRRTIFNLLGPLANPAGVDRQLVGVFDAGWTVPMAEALKSLGAIEALVVHGEDGLDELTVTAGSRAARLSKNRVFTETVEPETVGLKRWSLADIAGGTPEENARALVALLEGAEGGYRDIVLLNAGAALTVAGAAHDLNEGATIAARALDSGDARRKLEEWRAFR